jgi:hypothetical protein
MLIPIIGRSQEFGANRIIGRLRRLSTENRKKRIDAIEISERPALSALFTQAAPALILRIDF